MFRILQMTSKWLVTYTSYFVIAVAILALIKPSLFGWVSGVTQTVILGMIMLTMGLTLTVEDFKALATRPMDIFIGSVAQYTIMPIVAWVLTRVFQLDVSLAIGVILVGCCPGGVSSNIMSYLCKGDVAFSVGMTTTSTLIAPFITPMFVLWLADKSVDVDVSALFVNILVVTLLPVTVGFLCNYYLGRKKMFKEIQSVMPGMSVVGLALIVGGVICAVHSHLLDNGMQLFLLTFSVVFSHNAIGYVMGYLTGRIFKFDKAKNRTISIEVGMQNAGLATNLASNVFMATNPLAVVPCAVACVWHSISGTILAGVFVRYDKRKQKKREKPI